MSTKVFSFYLLVFLLNFLGVPRGFSAFLPSKDDSKKAKRKIKPEIINKKSETIVC